VEESAVAFLVVIPKGICFCSSVVIPTGALRSGGILLFVRISTQVWIAKIKLQKRWKIFRPQKVSVNQPQFTSNPPQLHHKKPHRKTTFSQKTPAKTPF